MSATNRGAERVEADFYPTPGWAVQRLLDRVPLPPGAWLEPCAGDGAIIRAAARPDVVWTAMDIREECRARLGLITPNVEIADYLKTPLSPHLVAITNPPFSLAQEFAEKLIGECEIVVMLLRIPWMASERRAGFFAGHMPDVYVLPNRPDFTGDGGDMTEYAWFVWPEGKRYRPRGHVEVLGVTPVSIRRANPRQTELAAIAGGGG